MNAPVKAKSAKPPRRKVAGAEKAAILFLCLGEKRGSELMKRLDEHDIARITRAMTNLGAIPADLVVDVIQEFSDSMVHGSGVVGTDHAAEAMLKKFLPADQVDDIMKNVRGAARERNMWKRFGQLNDQVISNYLKGEHAQTAAAILVNIDADVAARVLSTMEPERMQDIAERMVNMDAVPAHMMQEIEQTLQADIMAETGQPTAGENQQRMADLFNKLDAQAFDTISEALEDRAPDTFAAIKQKMFTFQDLMKLDAQALGQIMRGLEGNTLPVALRGAKKEERDHFLQALPGRSRDMLVDEMETMGPVRGKDVRAAQSAMVDYAKELAAQDVIVLPTGDDEDEMI